jgi:hypothetical protein
MARDYSGGYLIQCYRCRRPRQVGEACHLANQIAGSANPEDSLISIARSARDLHPALAKEHDMIGMLALMQQELARSVATNRAKREEPVSDGRR